MGELARSLADYLPADFETTVRDPDYGEETAAKNYAIPILRELGLEHADYEKRIESGDRPDFVWSDADGVTRIVGELKKPWDEDRSPVDPRYKIEQAIREARIYNEHLNLKYVVATDGRYIFFSNEYDEPPSEIELDLLELYRNPDDEEVERTVAQLRTRITDSYHGEWNEEPSQRDISDDEIFREFIDASRAALNEDLLPSIRRRFAAYHDRYEEYEGKRREMEREREELREQYRGHIDWEAYREAIDRVTEDLQFDYEAHLEGATASESVDEERWIDEVAEFREELLGLSRELSWLEGEYKRARNWHEKWQEWLVLTGKDYEGASESGREDIRETFQLQTLNLLYNRLLLIRTFEDLGIIGQVISDGFIKFFDEKVQLRENKYTEPLTTASRQAEEVYSPLFQRDTPHDWYYYEEDVLKTVLRRFDNFNFRNINRDIFGEMYQQCLDADERKRLGAFYTPPRAIRFLLDYAEFTDEETNVARSDEHAIDPACGSGTFVLEAMDRVLASLKDSGYDFTRDDDFLEAIRAINEKLRGFDVDPFAVQLAQSNLLIRILQERHNGDGNDTHLELPSFSIYETDSLLTVKESGQTSKERFYRARENDSENLESIIDAKEDDYRWVFGNPPYVRTHNQDPQVSAEYESLHETFGGEQSDVFLAFVEQGLEWLEDGGRLAFVISNKLLVTDASERAMQYVLDNATIDVVADLTRCKIFGVDVNVFPVLVVLTKRSGEEYEDVRTENETQVVKVYPKGSTESNEWGHALDFAAAELIEWRDEPTEYDFSEDFESETYPDVTNDDTYDTYEVDQRRFTEDWSEWADSLELNFQITDELWRVVKQLEDTDACVPLKNICPTLDDGGGRGGPPSRGEEPRYYREYLTDATDGVPVITGSNLGQFYLGDEEPDVEEYVDVDAMREDLEDGDVDADVSESKLDVFVNEKRIAYRAAAPGLTFAVDDPTERVRYYNKRAYFVLLNHGSNNSIGQYTDHGSIDDPHYICGLLNSDLLDFYYKAYYEHLSFRHAPAIECRTAHMTHLPIHVPTPEEREEISGYSKDLHEAKRELERLRHERDRLLDSFQERGDTTPLRVFVDSVGRSTDGYSIKSFNVEQDGGEVTLNRFHTVAMQDEDAARELAEFLEEYGDEYVAGDELRNLVLPTDLEEFRTEHAALAASIKELQSTISETEAQLNAAVYDLYGVGEHREEIEEYLESFLTVIE